MIQKISLFYANSLLQEHDVWFLSSENKIGVQNFETTYRTLENSNWTQILSIITTWEFQC